MKVRSLRKHGNAYGDKYEKFPGKQYEMPETEAEQLIADGLVEPVAEGGDGKDGGEPGGEG